MDTATPTRDAAERGKQTIAGVAAVTRQPATREEVRSALEGILAPTHTCWDGEAVVNALRRCGYEFEDPNGQLLLLDEITAIVRARNLRLALTTTPVVRRWVFQLFPADATGAWREMYNQRRIRDMLAALAAVSPCPTHGMDELFVCGACRTTVKCGLCDLTPCLCNR